MPGAAALSLGASLSLEASLKSIFILEASIS